MCVLREEQQHEYMCEYYLRQLPDGNHLQVCFHMGSSSLCFHERLAPHHPQHSGILVSIACHVSMSAC